MPFDAMPTKQDTRPIARLIEALRGPEPKWWDYGHFSSCALCTARQLDIVTENFTTPDA